MAKKKRDFAAWFWSAMRGLYRKQTYLDIWLARYRLDKSIAELRSFRIDYEKRAKELQKRIEESKPTSKRK